MEEFRSVMEEMSENTHLCETHTLVSSLADCSAWKHFLLSFLLKKNMTHENFRIFQATLIWDMFSCFPRSFYKRCSSVMLSPQIRAQAAKRLRHPFLGQDPLPVPLRGGCGQPLTWLLLVLRPLPCPGGPPLRLRRCRAGTFLQVSLRPLCLRGWRAQGRVWTGGRGGGERPRG